MGLVGGCVLGWGNDLVRAILRSRRGLGLCGGFGLWGPVRVNAELLGQVHVARFGHLPPPATQQRNTPLAPQVNTALQRQIDRQRHQPRRRGGGGGGRKRKRERHRKVGEVR